MNKVPKVIKEYLNLEFLAEKSRSEYFKIKTIPGVKFYIDYRGTVREYDKLSNSWTNCTSITLAQLLSGIYEIDHSPFYAEPIVVVNGVKYKSLMPDGILVQRIFRDKTVDYYCRAMGNMFAVDAEIPAEQREEIIKKMTDIPKK